MGSFSAFHWIVVAGVVALLFGRGKISGLMGDVAQGIKSFKRGMAEDDRASDDTTVPAKSATLPPASSPSENATASDRVQSISPSGCGAVQPAIADGDIGTNDGMPR
jgi:sec-independent protein translocase protein TatA